MQIISFPFDWDDIFFRYHCHLKWPLQTPNSPLASGTSGGRKASKRIILVCYGVLQDPNKVYVVFVMARSMPVFN